MTLEEARSFITSYLSIRQVHENARILNEHINSQMLNVLPDSTSSIIEWADKLEKLFNKMINDGPSFADEIAKIKTEQDEEER